MSSNRSLRGGCQCGRNSYTIDLPATGLELAQVLFDTDPRHRIFQASPLAAFIRVPLGWYHSYAFAYFPDETTAAIRRVYTHPSQGHSRRQFCGFCGTPLSYWSEDPPGEADFIRLTLGSLCSEDLGDLEDLGLLPEEGGPAAAAAASASAVSRLQQDQASSPTSSGPGTEATREQEAAGAAQSEAAAAAAGDGALHVVGRETLGVPWFDSMVAGSRLGNLRMSRGNSGSRDGTVRYEWEVVEWTEGADGGDDDDVDAAGAGGSGTTTAEAGGPVPNPSKRHKHGHSASSAQQQL